MPFCHVSNWARTSPACLPGYNPLRCIVKKGWYCCSTLSSHQRWELFKSKLGRHPQACFAIVMILQRSCKRWVSEALLLPPRMVPDTVCHWGLNKKKRAGSLGWVVLVGNKWKGPHKSKVNEYGTLSWHLKFQLSYSLMAWTFIRSRFSLVSIILFVVVVWVSAVLELSVNSVFNVLCTGLKMVAVM